MFRQKSPKPFCPRLCAGKPSRFPRSTRVSEGSPTGHPCPDVERAASCLRPFGLVLRLRDSLGLSRGAKNYFTLPIHWGGPGRGGSPFTAHGSCPLQLGGGSTVGDRQGSRKLEQRRRPAGTLDVRTTQEQLPGRTNNDLASTGVVERYCYIW